MILTNRRLFDNRDRNHVVLIAVAYAFLRRARVSGTRDPSNAPFTYEITARRMIRR
jgi:hypothetical protein